MEGKLKDLDGSISGLAQKADQVKETTKTDAVETLAKIHEQRDKAKAKLDEARDAGIEGWKNLKGEVETAMHDLRQACENAKGIFD